MCTELWFGGAAMCYALGFGIVFVSGRLVKVTEHLLV